MVTQNFTFQGYAATFYNIDAGNDVIMPQALSHTLLNRPPASVALLWQHNLLQPIGVWQHLQITPRGLWVKGMLPAAIQQAREAATLIELGGLTGLSIGFQVITQKTGLHNRRKVRFITQLHLIEISLVTLPMNTLARINAAKQHTPPALCYGRAQPL